MRAHSCPTYNMTEIIGDINKLCSSIKKTSSTVRWELFDLASTSQFDILTNNGKEFYPLVGMYPESLISDSETTLDSMKKLLAKAKKIEVDSLKNFKGDMQKKALRAVRCIRYIMSDLYNNIVILENVLGRK